MNGVKMDFWKPIWQSNPPQVKNFSKANNFSQHFAFDKRQMIIKQEKKNLLIFSPPITVAAQEERREYLPAFFREICDSPPYPQAALASL